MNISSFKTLSRSKKIGALLIGTTLAWSLGLPLYIIGTASAASLSNISDTILSSAPSAATTHTIVYTTINSMVGGTNGTTTIQFSPGNVGGATDEFTLASLTLGNVTFSGSVALATVANFAACTAAASQAYVSTITNTAGNRTVNIAVCPGDTVAPQIITIVLATNVVSPSTVNSYVVRVAGTQTDSADTRVAIVNQVTMSAKVDTTFTFTISGTATSTPANGTSTTFTTTATAIPFNTVTPGGIYTGAQQLNVTTNADNGFQVTVVANGPMISTGGGDIDFFTNGTELAAPAAWSAPSNTLGAEDTYGHFGITTNDAVTAAFGSNQWVGNFNAGSPLQVFFHNAPSDGVQVNTGSTTVAYQMQIGSLQQAANDYTNVLTYVATPIF